MYADLEPDGCIEKGPKEREMDAKVTVTPYSGQAVCKRAAVGPVIALSLSVFLSLLFSLISCFLWQAARRNYIMFSRQTGVERVARCNIFIFSDINVSVYGILARNTSKQTVELLV